VLEYIAKYISEPEKKTGTYRQLIQRVLPSVSSNNPVLSAASKLMNRNGIGLPRKYVTFFLTCCYLM
jgi:hypothetical protein